MKLMEEKETDDDADADDDERGNFKSLCFPEVRALRRAFTRGSYLLHQLLMFMMR